MASKVAKAAVENRAWSPIIQAVKTVLLGRVENNPLRFPNQMTERPGPEANLPPGPSHKLSGNYYYTRDGRREVAFPDVIADETKTKAIAAGGEEGSAETAPAVVVKQTGKRTPGALFRYSE